MRLARSRAAKLKVKYFSDIIMLCQRCEGGGPGLLHVSDQHGEDEEAGDDIIDLLDTDIDDQIGCVTVLVPPDIDETLSSGDVVVAEGGNTTLSCVTYGQPQ